MVKNIMKNRWWWQNSDTCDFKECQFIWTAWRQKKLIKQLPSHTNESLNCKIDSKIKLYNKLEENFHLSNKKALYYNMRSYYEALKEDMTNAMPLTFHIKSIDDPEYQRFQHMFSNNEHTNNIWIIKPGENTNRGQGIDVKNNLKDITSICE